MYFCHVLHPTTFTTAVTTISPIAGVLLGTEALYAIFGQAGNTHRTVQSFCYKYWSGNYNHAFYVFTPRGLEKLRARIADKSSPLHQLGPCGADNAGPRGWGLLSEEKVEVGLVRALGAMWYAQLVVRVLPKLLADHFGGTRNVDEKRSGDHVGGDIVIDKRKKGGATAGDGGGNGSCNDRDNGTAAGGDCKGLSLTESFGGIFHNMVVHQWLMGVVSHEVAYTDGALSFLHSECGFEEGELTVVTLYAFGSLSHLCEGGCCTELGEMADGARGGGRWVVTDAKTGVVRRGRQSSAAIAAGIRRPSDWDGGGVGEGVCAAS